MSAPVSLLPQLTGSVLPPPNVVGLSDDEQRLITGLSQKLTLQSVDALLRWSYYDGLQRLYSLGVSIPPVLAGVRTVVDWPRICVDPLVQRCVVDGFRLPGSTDVDDELRSFWVANDLGYEAPMSFLDSFVSGRGYMIGGSPDMPGDAPIITVESPLNLSMIWDPRTRRVTAAYQSFEAEGTYRAALYVPGESVFMSRRDVSSTQWVVDDRDQHGLDLVPVVRLPNRSRTSDREGRSEITAAVMNTTDSACRSLLGMEIAREFYSVPHRYVLGASESNFTDAEGNAKSAWDMAMNKFLAIERDEEAEIPQVGQFTAFDPSVFTKIVDEHAKLMASYTGFPPAYFGQTTTANPASADAIRVGENGLVRRAEQAQRQFAGPLQDMMRIAWRLAHGGAEVPEQMRQLETDWLDAATPTPAATSDAMTKQASAGMVPPTSDVVLKRLGYTDVERQRLEQDRKADLATQIEAELARSIEARYARTDSAIAHDIGAPPTATQGAPVPPPTQPPR